MLDGGVTGVGRLSWVALGTVGVVTLESVGVAV